MIILAVLKTEAEVLRQRQETLGVSLSARGLARLRLGCSGEVDKWLDLEYVLKSNRIFCKLNVGE